MVQILNLMMYLLLKFNLALLYIIRKVTVLPIRPSNPHRHLKLL